MDFHITQVLVVCACALTNAVKEKADAYAEVANVNHQTDTKDCRRYWPIPFHHMGRT